MTSGLIADGPWVLPEAAYLVGVGGGAWHAVGRELMNYLRIGPVDSVTFAECGELVRVAPKFGSYDRITVPVSYHPCQRCAWVVAAAGGAAAMEAEARLLGSAADQLAALDRVMPDPFVAFKACRAVIEGAGAPDSRYGLDHPATVQVLAAIAAHAPVLLVSEACSEGGCKHPRNVPCPGNAACEACSLQDGDWAGEWQGQYREECTVAAPCAVLLALAKHAGVL